MLVRPERAHAPGSILPGALVGAVVVEFLLLRTGTRALIHIPGLGQYETPIRALAEIGRFAYYLAIVLLVATLGAFLFARIRSRSSGDSVLAVSIAMFMVAAVAGRAGLLSPIVVGWLSLVVVPVVVALTWRGIRSVPIALFTLSSIAAGWSVLGQGDGGGLSGVAVDWLVISAEILLVLAAVSSPLLVARRPGLSSLIAGSIAVVLTAGAFVTGGSTLSIIILWNIGVPGWLPWFAYALAVGAVTTSLWLAATSGRQMTAIGLVLLVTGGVGVISTYQTGLVLAAVLFLSVPPGREAEPEVDATDDLVLDRREFEPVGIAGG